MSDTQQPQVLYHGITGTVKWYRADKGFGFLSSPQVPEDVFIHFSLVENYGLETLETGDTITCDVGPSQRGLQAMKILHIQANPQTEPDADKVKEVLEGNLKWYSPRKGFGFMQPDDNNGDVFVHLSVLRRLGHDNLEPGTRLRAYCAHSPRGREAIALEILAR